MQKRFSIWNPGPDEVRKTLLRQIAEKWYVITQQEASQYVKHEICHERFHVTDFAGCVVSSPQETPSIHTSASNRSAFTTRGEVCQIMLLKENMDGCVFSRASFRRAAASGQKVFTVLSLHISSICAKKKDLSRKSSRPFVFSRSLKTLISLQAISMAQLGVVAAATISVTPPGPTPLWGPRSIPNSWADVCGIQRFWKVNKHGAFSTLRQALGLRSSGQSCHRETWLHLQIVEWSNRWNHQAHYNGNIRLKERRASSGNIAPKVTSAKY